MVAELQEEVEKLRSIWNAKREREWLCQALVSSKQEKAPGIPQQEGNAVPVPQQTQGRSYKDVNDWKQVQA